MNGITTSSPYVPTPKLASSGIAGTFAGVGVWALNRYAKADIPPEIASQIAVLVGFIAGWIAPHSAPTAKQLEQIREVFSEEQKPKPITPKL